MIEISGVVFDRLILTESEGGEISISISNEKEEPYTLFCEEGIGEALIKYASLKDIVESREVIKVWKEK